MNKQYTTPFDSSVFRTIYSMPPIQYCYRKRYYCIVLKSASSIQFIPIDPPLPSSQEEYRSIQPYLDLPQSTSLNPFPSDYDISTGRTSFPV
jgi:hypothetical protein